MIHDLLIAPFDLGFMRRALVGCFALSLAAPPLGLFLVLRRMSLTSDVQSVQLIVIILVIVFYDGCLR